MKNLDRTQNSAPESLVHQYNRAKQMEELESRRKQVDDLWNQIEAADVELAKQKQEADKASAVARKHKKENENLLQRLMGALQSRNSMRGRLGNMTMQRNRAIRQVEQLTSQNRTVMEQLKLTTDKLGESYQQVNALQTEYDQDMTQLARAYQAVSLEQRATLPEPLRTLLEQLEQDYTGVEG
jgi:DNA repair exonuclease SbcCD ATPase subunit